MRRWSEIVQYALPKFRPGNIEYQFGCLQESSCQSSSWMKTSVGPLLLLHASTFVNSQVHLMVLCKFYDLAVQWTLDMRGYFSWMTWICSFIFFFTILVCFFFSWCNYYIMVLELQKMEHALQKGSKNTNARDGSGRWSGVPVNRGMWCPILWYREWDHHNSQYYPR